MRAKRAADGDFKHDAKTKKKIAKLTAEAMAADEVKQKMVDGAVRRWSDDAERKKIAERNSKTYQLTHKETGEGLVIKNMQAFCRQTSSHPRKVHNEWQIEQLVV